MQDWIKDELAIYDLKRVFIGFSDHALKDKNLRPEDIDKAVETIRSGEIVPEKSDPARRNVCFKRYFGNNITYFVVGGLHEEFIRIVTVIKEKGRV